MVALKASRMNNMNSGEMNDKELDIALERVAEDDNKNDNNDDFERTPSFRSPDKSFEGSLSLVRYENNQCCAVPGAFLDPPGIWDVNKIQIRGEQHPRSFFRELRNSF
jgi:hypothetical protein